MQKNLGNHARQPTGIYKTLQLQVKTTSLNHQEGADTQSLLTSNHQATFTQNNACVKTISSRQTVWSIALVAKKRITVSRTAALGTNPHFHSTAIDDYKVADTRKLDHDNCVDFYEFKRNLHPQSEGLRGYLSYSGEMCNPNQEDYVDTLLWINKLPAAPTKTIMWVRGGFTKPLQLQVKATPLNHHECADTLTKRLRGKKRPRTRRHWVYVPSNHICPRKCIICNHFKCSDLSPHETRPLPPLATQSHTPNEQHCAACQTP